MEDGGRGGEGRGGEAIVWVVAVANLNVRSPNISAHNRPHTHTHTHTRFSVIWPTGTHTKLHPSPLPFTRSATDTEPELGARMMAMVKEVGVCNHSSGKQIRGDHKVDT